MAEADVTAGAGLCLRPITASDEAVLLAANTAEVPRVGPLEPEGWSALLGHCDLALLAACDGRPAGFVLAIAPGATYASPNYRAFEARGSNHLYVDRVLVLPGFRRRGVASALYDAVERHARATGREEVTCEVNVDPPNPASLAFHAARGFDEVGRQQTGSVQVALLARAVTPA